MSSHLDFFGLRERPFTSSPDPRFLHMTIGHREALAQLVFGVQEQKGFMMLTGEVGTGKTTLVQALIRRLDENTAVAHVTNSLLTFEGILEYAFEDLGIAKPGESFAQRLFALQNFLIERRRAGQNTVFILDEAQNFEPYTLEQIRLLSNFETASEKILQIILVGQPELRNRLNLPELRQLKQRISLRAIIPTLTAEDTREYIRTRLRVAGARDFDIFSASAVEGIAKYTGGIPRVVNTVCDHCLTIAYADQVRRISREVVAEAVTYLEGGDRPSSVAAHGRPGLVRAPATERAGPPASPPAVGGRRWIPPAWGLVALAGVATLLGFDFLAGGPRLLEQAARWALGLAGR
jgi:general secretion pathway protein A